MKKLINFPPELYRKADSLRYKLRLPSFTAFVVEAVKEKVKREQAASVKR
jgi:hypothetical protein